MTSNRLAQRAVAHPLTLAGFTVYSLAWFAFERGNIGWDGFAAIAGIYLAVLIVRGQTPDIMASQAKLDAVVKATPGASNELVRAEERDEAEIDALREAPCPTA